MSLYRLHFLKVFVKSLLSVKTILTAVIKKPANVAEIDAKVSAPMKSMFIFMHIAE